MKTSTTIAIIDAIGELLKEIKLYGCAVAAAISWSLHHHIGWALLHGAFSWLYILYFWWTRTS